MKKIIGSIFAICFFGLTISAQNDTISVFDFVKIKNEKRAETLFYYQNNWQVLREKALAKGFIESFELIETKPTESAKFDLILITRYSDSKQFEKAEENFQILIKESGALKLLNQLKPNDFRENVFSTVGQSPSAQKKDTRIKQ